MGYARSKIDDFHKHCLKNVRLNGLNSAEKEDLQKQFASRLTYVQGSYDREESFSALEEVLKKLEAGAKECHRGFYLALPPSTYEMVTRLLRQHCYGQEGKGWTRMIIEKPFGHNLETSNALSQHLSTLWQEEELYRIDHYLGKEMVKNVMILRFANTIFNGIWNRNFIDNVQITFREPFGTEGRAGYFGFHFFERFCPVASLISDLGSQINTELFGM